jgi:dienelactone hydrolase
MLDEFHGRSSALRGSTRVAVPWYGDGLQPWGETMSRRLLLSCIALLVATAFAARAQTSEPPVALRENVYRVPLGAVSGTDQEMHTIVYRPRGDGPFPLVVINHGSPRDAASRSKFTARFSTASAWFIRRGYAVAVPTRRGYGPTGGGWAETFGRCDSPDYHSGGLATAQDIRAAVLYLREQPFVDPDRIVLVGQSAGGWGVLASAGQKLPGVVAIVNFAGGRGSRGPDNVCTPYALVQAARRFGAGAELPVLSIYTANDSYFNPSLARQMHEAFVAGGARRARLLELPAFGEDGHGMFAHRDGPSHWGEHVQAFLVSLGLPE